MAWQEVARAQLPGGDVLTLRRHGADFEIRFNLLELMSSRNPVSERVLAQAVCSRIEAKAAHILIGGLGMGYTVRAVLDQGDADVHIMIAELVPEVIAWNRGPLAGLALRPLDDPRVTVRNEDVANVIRAHPGTFDAILMDVDNGPEAALFPANRYLYTADGVTLILSGLKSGGVLGLWSSGRAPEFELILEGGGFRSEHEKVDVLDKGRLAHAIYLIQPEDKT